jgi:hypothetical protein
MRLPAPLIVALALLQVPAAHPQALDVFGVTPGSVAELERCFGAAARELVAASETTDRVHARELEERLERKIKEAGAFEAVDISIVHYFEPGLPAALTFNLTPAGKGASIKFLPEPEQEVPDPDGLLASWREYQKIGTALELADQLDSPPSCPGAHHCVSGFDHPKLRPYGDVFTQKVPARREDLVRVLTMDKDATDRAAAAFLLAHLPAARDVVEALLPRLYDPASSVRNNVMRVFAYMADHGTAGSISPEPILPFLRSPVGTDRNKAVAIVAGLASDKRHRKLLIGRAGCDLVRLLEMKQPNQNDWAHRALVKLRGKDLGASDPAAWRRWLKTQKVTCQPEPEIRPGQLCPLLPPARTPGSGGSAP